MRLGTWLGLLGTTLLIACGDDSSDDADRSSDESKAVAEALTEGLQFERGLLRRGTIPEASAETVRLTQEDDVLRLVPGESSLMSLGVENPEDDPVESVLLQFEDAEQHVEVAADSGDAGVNDEISLDFGVDDAICDAFCNKIFILKLIQAVKLRGGDVSRHLLRTFELDCREHGRANRCEDDGNDPDAGTSSGGRGGSGGSGGGSGTTTVARELMLAIRQVNLDACMCANPGSTDAECMDAPYPATAVSCIVDAVTEDAALSAPASCLTQRLNVGTSCTCADTACHGDAIATAHAACDSNASLESALEDCDIGTLAATP
jgi:hypothetical protein